MFNKLQLCPLWLQCLLILQNSRPAHARPKPQEDVSSNGQSTSSAQVAPVTSIVTSDGSVIEAIFTPTSLAISGLQPPITAATTITTTDTAGETAAIAVAAGAGIVAGAALAAWLFEPKPGLPPAPTSPPSYPTKTQNTDDQEETTTQLSLTLSTSSTSSAAPACLLATEGPNPEFALASEQPQWTVAIPSHTISTVSPECTSSNDNGQLFHGLSPDFIGELADVFCDGDLSKDLERSLDKDDLPSDSSWNRDDGPEFPVVFTFDLKAQLDGCADNCRKAYAKIISSCEYDSNYLFGGGSIGQGCGTYQLRIQGDPVTKLTCTGVGDNPLARYMYRDAAKDAIHNFCTAQDGKTVKQGDQSSFIEETAFSIRYTDSCAGSGTYTVEKDLCESYLGQTLDACDTNDFAHKHGGTLQDVDNCGEFNFHPTSYNLIECYPGNAEKGYVCAHDLALLHYAWFAQEFAHNRPLGQQINGGTHIAVTKDMAVDAIKAFCDRSGDGQKYTLDPDVQPDEGFTQDTCTTNGMASCGYFYHNDGTRVTEDGDIGDIIIRMEATHFNPNDALTCSPPQVYDVQGERCKSMLGMFTGDEAIDMCIGDDPNKLDLGTIIENADKGCVTWNMWAVKTHN